MLQLNEELALSGNRTIKSLSKTWPDRNAWLSWCPPISLEVDLSSTCEALHNYVLSVVGTGARSHSPPGPQTRDARPIRASSYRPRVVNESLGIDRRGGDLQRSCAIDELQNAFLVVHQQGESCLEVAALRCIRREWKIVVDAHEAPS
jgi:hypothetical protein